MKITNTHKYIFFVGCGIFLFYFLYKDYNLSEILEKLQKTKIEWILLSALVTLISHFSRAIRWNIMLRSIGYSPRVITSFTAVLITYIINIMIPRAGEIARCGALQKTDNIPSQVSFGSVLAERALDFIILLFLVFLTFLFQYNRVKEILLLAFENSEGGYTPLLVKLAAILLIGIIGSVIIYLNIEKIKNLTLYKKLASLLIDVWTGVKAINNLPSGQKKWFYFHTVSIWVMYFFMTYVLFFSIEETSELGLACGLAVLAMGGIGMAFPSPGGAGSYHLLVTITLVAYGLTDTSAKYFALLMHSSQVLLIIIVGSISLLLNMFVLNPKTKPAVNENEETLSN